MRPPFTFYGPLMVSLIASLAIFAILSTMAFQSWTSILRRDAEAEMIFRAEEIARALKRYQKDQGRLPSTLDELMEAGNRGQYFLRKAYEDPLADDGEWGLLYAAPGGGVYDPNAPGATAPMQLGDTRNNPVDPSALQGSDATRTATGMPIAGVRTLSSDPPFRFYKGQREYSQWTFTVFDLEGPQNQSGAGAGAPNTPNPPNQPGGDPAGNN